MTEMGRHAVMSGDEQYRYNLSRSWEEGNGMILFVMLNPSTADADIDDPTIRRCIGFAQREEFKRLMVVNLFAFRETDPSLLPLADDPVGPENYHYIALAAEKADAVALAWGASVMATSTYVDPVLAILEVAGHDPECLGCTASGAPRHPLYLAADTEFEEFHS
jgi:hypothetical protein